MSYGPLPKKVDPRKLSEHDAEISGVADVHAMPRFSSYLCEDAGEVNVDLKFSLDEQRLRIVSGQASGTVKMVCQRCLEPVEVDVEARVNLAVTLNEEQAKNLPRYYDPLIVESEDVELLSLVEDELILSLPLVAYHDDCSVQTSFGDQDAVRTQNINTNPFSVLAQLKDKANKS